MNSTLAFGPVASLRIFIATGIFTVSPSGTQMPWRETHIHTHTHTHIDIQRDRDMQTDEQAQTHINTHTHTHTYIQKDRDMQATDKHTHTHTRTETDTQAITCIQRKRVIHLM